MRKLSFFISVAAVMALATPACAASVKAAKGNTKQMAKQMALQREVGLCSITEDAARAHVYFLADDLLEGRRAGERGSRIAKQYIISQMRQLGLKPMLGNTRASLSGTTSLKQVIGKKIYMSTCCILCYRT